MCDLAAEEFGDHLNNLVNALIALAPSRNYITQFLYVIHMMNGEIEFPTLYDAYPELMKDKECREKLAKIFGISFGEKVSLAYDGYGRHVSELIDKIFKKFEDREFRESLNSLLQDIRTESLPNLQEEWVKLKLEGVLDEPTYGINAMRVLKTIAEGKYPDVSDLDKEGIEENDVRRIVELLKDKYRLIEEGSGWVEELNTSKEGYKLSEELEKYSKLLKELTR